MACPTALRTSPSHKATYLRPHFACVQVKELGSEDWKARLAAMETVVAAAAAPAPGVIVTLAQGVGVLPGWNDKNFQVWGVWRCVWMEWRLNPAASSGVGCGKVRNR
eukprot:311057-Chlamydomonas_euryale.AAC.1